MRSAAGAGGTNDSAATTGPPAPRPPGGRIDAHGVRVVSQTRTTCAGPSSTRPELIQPVAHLKRGSSRWPASPRGGAALADGRRGGGRHALLERRGSASSRAVVSQSHLDLPRRRPSSRAQALRRRRWRSYFQRLGALRPRIESIAHPARAESLAAERRPWSLTRCDLDPTPTSTRPAGPAWAGKKRRGPA